MPRTQPGETTAPSLNSTFGSESQGPLVLAWLFPRTDGPSIELSAGRGEIVIGRDDDCALALSGSDVRVGGWVGVVTRHGGPLGSIAPGLFGGGALRSALVGA